MPPDFERKILALLQQLPEGHVTTYGTLAALAGYPRHARHVGKLLGKLPEGVVVPWYRILGSTGHIARPGTPEADWQRVLLEQEGVEISDSGKISLFRYGWPAESFIRKGK